MQEKAILPAEGVTLSGAYKAMTANGWHSGEVRFYYEVKDAEGVKLII